MGQHVSPRTIQIIEAQRHRWTFDPPIDAVLGRRRTRYVVLSCVAPAARQRCLLDGPLVECIREHDKLVGEGFTLASTTPVPPDPRWLCSWCSGTGRPQLSVGTLGAMLRG